MRHVARIALAALLISTLASPGVALAKKSESSQGHGRGDKGGAATSKSDKADSGRKSKAAASDKRGSSAHSASSKKVKARAPKRAKVGAALGAGAFAASGTVNASTTAPMHRGPRATEGTGSIPPSSSVVATAVPRGRARAFERISGNLERAVAGVASGTRAAVPPGLLRVWLKFAYWLGVDPTTAPTIPGSPENPTGESTLTAEPTGTVPPTQTVPSAPPVTSSEPPAP